MKVTPAKIEGFLKKPSASLILLHGPDAGQIQEYAERLTRLPDAEVTRLHADVAIKAPGRLHEAASSRGLFATGTPVIRLRGAGDKATRLLKEVLAAPPEARIIVEAGELTAKSSLRKLFEKEAGAAAIACYPFDAQERVKFVDANLRDAGKRAAAGVTDLIAARLPDDRAAARRELEKLVLCAGDDSEIAQELVDSVIADGGDSGLGDAILAAGEGDQRGCERAVQRLLTDGESPVGLIRIALRHFHQLHDTRVAIDTGVSAADAIGKLRPPVFWKDRARLQAQATRWPLPAIERALDRLHATERQAKMTGYPDGTLVAHLFWTIAMQARQLQKGRRR
ncbi:DNA polymerase III subunit delta [Rhodovibrio sodomensis]|uniref:DNA polymerase III subunit delta n=1 Tax=Rhodovibrio sodomensis TaxID=1088 RepID=UPI0019038487